MIILTLPTYCNTAITIPPSMITQQVPSDLEEQYRCVFALCRLSKLLNQDVESFLNTSLFSNICNLAIADIHLMDVESLSSLVGILYLSLLSLVGIPIYPYYPW